MSVRPLKRLWLLAVLLTAWLALAAPAAALGPFSHLQFSRDIWPQAAARLGLDASDQGLLPAALAGSLAPDAGYYLDGLGPLSDAAHSLKPFQFTQALMDLAQDGQEKAWALGWLSHAMLDRLMHRELINPQVGGPFSRRPLEHKRLEWGLDCWQLAQPGSEWLWSTPIDWGAGLGLWSRALERVYGARVPREVLRRAMAAQRREVERLPYVFWLSGRLKRPDHPWGNALGWLLGHSVRHLFLWYLAWRGNDLDERAVLTARYPGGPELESFKGLRPVARAQAMAVLAGAPWPPGKPDGETTCPDESCPAARRARAWLEKRR